MSQCNPRAYQMDPKYFVKNESITNHIPVKFFICKVSKGILVEAQKVWQTFGGGTFIAEDWYSGLTDTYYIRYGEEINFEEYKDVLVEINMR